MATNVALSLPRYALTVLPGLLVLDNVDCIDEAVETAIKPFINNLANNVSERLSVTNLGWVVKCEAIHRGNCNRVPLLFQPRHAQHGAKTRTDRALDQIVRDTLGLTLEKGPGARSCP